MHATSRDAGVVTPIEMMFVLVFVLLAVGFLGFLGRLHAAGVQVSNTSQSAARAASRSGAGIFFLSANTVKMTSSEVYLYGF